MHIIIVTRLSLVQQYARELSAHLRGVRVAEIVEDIQGAPPAHGRALQYLAA
jgi:hypothetical protein